MSNTQRSIIALVTLAAMLCLFLVWVSDHEEAKSPPAPRLSQNPINQPSQQGASAVNETGIEIVPSPDIPSQSAAPLWTPDYGPLIERSRAQAIFELLDTRGQPLDRDIEGIKLWRRVGAYWLSDNASYDNRDGRISCPGLERGEYELEIEAGPYGAFRHNFWIERVDGKRQTVNAVLH